MKHKFCSCLKYARSTLVAAIAGMMVCAGPALAQQRTLPSTTLSAGIHLIQAEVAGNQETRTLGLMGRKSMAQGAGMLFLFDESALHCMWMRNTLIPLSVAFIDEHGRILNIADMKPLDETTHCATQPARYALEMNLGWFKKRGIAAGAAIQGLERLSPAAR